MTSRQVKFNGQHSKSDLCPIAKQRPAHVVTWRHYHPHMISCDLQWQHRLTSMCLDIVQQLCAQWTLYQKAADDRSPSSQEHKVHSVNMISYCTLHKHINPLLQWLRWSPLGHACTTFQLYTKVIHSKY